MSSTAIRCHKLDQLSGNTRYFGAGLVEYKGITDELGVIVSCKLTIKSRLLLILSG